MALDATYDHLLRLISNRAMGWLRDRIKALPPRIGCDDPVLPVLALAGRMAPVFTAWRGAPSPLAEIVAHRLDARLARHLAIRALRQGANVDQLAPLLVGCRLAARNEPLWDLALARLGGLAPSDPAERLSLTDTPDTALSEEIEALLVQPLDPVRPDPAQIDLFYRCLTEAYRFGAQRPQWLAPRAFGLAYDKARRLAEWAVASRDVATIAQMTTCLRLIDPDHDVYPLLSELIACQRPDGSFPQRCAVSSSDQDLASAAHPTLLVLTALQCVTYRHRPGPEPARAAMRLCADQIAGQVITRLEKGEDLANPQRFRAALAVTCAGGRNGFALCELHGYAPEPPDLARLALAPFPDAGRHARATLSLRAPINALLAAGNTIPDELADDLHRLLNPLHPLGSLPPAFASDWDQLARTGDTKAFLAACRDALRHGSAQITPNIRERALNIVTREHRAFLARPRAPLAEQVDRLEAVTLLSRLIEPEARMAAAA